jgi:ketosteroid isomerase-like protein
MPGWTVTIPTLAFIRILSFVILFLVTGQGTSILARPDSSKHSSLAQQAQTSSHTRLAAIPVEKGAQDLVSSWCSAYRQSDPERLAALQTGEIEIVDRFGDWHRLIGQKSQERFWRDGFDMIRREEFRPECTVQHARLIRSDVAIVQATVSYIQGIALKGDRIRPFSETHTFVLVMAKGYWLISAQNIVQQNSRELKPGTSPSE